MSPLNTCHLLIPTLSDSLVFWRRYVDDTLCFVKKGFREHVLRTINGFHKNIKFTFEEERNNMISFLDVLLIRRENGIDLTVFRKETNTDVYINWDAFAPETWKTSTLKLLVRRAHKISTQDYLLQMELDHLEKTFVEINNFPPKVVQRVFRQVKEEMRNFESASENENDFEQTNQEKVVHVTLPYAGKVGENMIKEISKELKKLKHHKIKPRFAYKAKRLASKFNLKDKVDKKHQHNVVYQVNCPDCENVYIGETGRRLIQRTMEHAGKDKNSHVHKHSLETGHTEISLNNIKVMNSNYKTYYKRKVSEALYIKQRNPVLNVQDTSVPLRLLN